MVHIFNRALVLRSRRLDQISQARRVLSGAGVECCCTAKARTAPSPLSAAVNLPHVGTLGARGGARTEYRLYVKKCDLPLARSLL